MENEKGMKLEALLAAQLTAIQSIREQLQEIREELADISHRQINAQLIKWGINK